MQYGFIALLMLLFPEVVSAASLKPETLNAWEEYVQSATARMQDRLRSGAGFLWVDEDPDRLARVRNGEIVVSPASDQIPKKVPACLMLDWIGAAFIPNAKLDDVLPVIRDYGRYAEIYAPAVVRSRAIETSEFEDRFSVLLVNKPLISKTAIDSDYQSSYIRVSAHRWYSITQTTRVQEIANYAAPGQHTLPEDEGNGLIWRVYSLARFEERDGGVQVEVEAMALSREIPASLRWMIEPIVRRVARGSLVTSLKQTEDAVRSSGELANHAPGRPPSSTNPSFR